MSDNPIAPAGDNVLLSAPEPLSIDAAADRLTAIEQHEAAAPADTRSEPNARPDPASQPADGPEDDRDWQDGEGSNDIAGQPGEQTIADDNASVELDRLHGNTRVRLRDGTEWTVGEIKRRLDDLRQVDQSRQEYETRQSQLEVAAAQFTQQAQYFEHIASQAIAAIQAQLPEIPPQPDISLRASDPFRYQELRDDRERAIEDYNAKVGQIHEIEQAHAMQVQQRQREQGAAMQGYLEEQRTQLFQAMPDLRDEAKRTEFMGDLLEYGTKTYGFQPQELDNAYDHRLMRMARDAIAYRKLQANKPKPNQPQRAPQGVPVQQPGRRVSGPEARSEQREEVRSRVSKPGGLSMSEAASLLTQIEKG